MISLLHWDGWKILTSPCCFSGITQGQDQNYWQQVESGQWDGWSIWTERGVSKFLSTIPDISGENDGRLTDCYKGRDRRWVKDREIWNVYTEKNRRLNCVRAFLMTFINFWSEPIPSCSLFLKYQDVVNSSRKIMECFALVSQTLNCCDTFNAVVSFLLTTGTQHRSRRHARSFPPIHPCNLCAGGKGTVTYWDKCWCSYRGGYWRIQKRVVSRICVTIRRCYRWGCGEEHYVYYVYCSQYVCERPTYRPHPYYGRNASIAL